MKRYKTFSISLQPKTTYAMARTMKKKYGLSLSKTIAYCIFRTWRRVF